MSTIPGDTVMPVGFASPTTAISGLAALAANSCDAASGRIVTLRFLLSPTRRVMLSMGLPESSVTLMDSGAYAEAMDAAADVKPG